MVVRKKDGIVYFHFSLTMLFQVNRGFNMQIEISLSRYT